MSWQDIVADEKKYMAQIGTRLSEFEQQIGNNEAWEQIYAGLWEAYNKGETELAVFEKEFESYDRAGQTGVISNEQMQMFHQQGIPQDRWVAATQVLASMRCLRRPSDLFRAELRRQNAAIVGNMQQLLKDPSLDAQGLTQDLRTMGIVMCSFDSGLVEPQQAPTKEPWWRKLMSVEALGLAAVSGVSSWYYFMKWKPGKAKTAAPKLTSSKESPRLTTQAPMTLSGSGLLRDEVEELPEEIEEEFVSPEEFVEQEELASPEETVQEVEEEFEEAEPVFVEEEYAVLPEEEEIRMQV